MKYLLGFLLACSLYAAIGDNAPNVPTTWVASHPRLGAPSNADLVAIWSGGTLPGRYTNGWGNCTAGDSLCSNASTVMPYFRYLMVAVMAYQTQHTGGCNAAPCTTWLASLDYMAALGPLWGPLYFKDDAATGDGAGHITLTTGGLSFLTGCGGSCAGVGFAYLGWRYNIDTVQDATHATLKRNVVGDNPNSIYPNGTGLKIRLMSNFNAPNVTVSVFALMYDWFYSRWVSQGIANDMATAWTTGVPRW